MAKLQMYYGLVYYYDSACSSLFVHLTSRITLLVLIVRP